MSKERPILFSGPMVQAILADRKTQTRRVVKPQPTTRNPGYMSIKLPNGIHGGPPAYMLEVLAQYGCPYGQPGDRLWVRETFMKDDHTSLKAHVESTRYKATDDVVTERQRMLGQKWKPSIHMPRHRSRILLEVVSVRVERLQDISKFDAYAEGMPGIEKGSYDWLDQAFKVPPRHWPISLEMTKAQQQFAELWDMINGKPLRGKPHPRLGQMEYANPRSWDANPWVWVVEFKRCA